MNQNGIWMFNLSKNRLYQSIELQRKFYRSNFMGIYFTEHTKTNLKKKTTTTTVCKSHLLLAVVIYLLNQKYPKGVDVKHWVSQTLQIPCLGRFCPSATGRYTIAPKFLIAINLPACLDCNLCTNNWRLLYL